MTNGLSGDTNIAVQDRQAERMVLAEIVALHPARLTTEELVTRLEAGPGDRLPILDALGALKRSGLARLGDVIEPTLAAIAAAEIFDS